MIWTNKHVVVALLVAPVLAIAAWYAVGHFLGERPHAAVEGGSYLLVARSNCRYDSGGCDLRNADFELQIRPIDVSNDVVALELTSRFALQSATVALVEAGEERPPTQMESAGSGGQLWAGNIPAPADDNRPPPGLPPV